MKFYCDHFDEIMEALEAEPELKYFQPADGSHKQLVRLQRVGAEFHQPKSEWQLYLKENASKIPFLIEKPGNHPDGCMVIFLDGSGGFIRFDEHKWPVTKKSLELLNQLSVNCG